MGQTQSMMRWLGQSLKGKKGETLYPGKKDPEASWTIDSLVELSDGFLGANWGGYLGPQPPSDEIAKEAASTVWCDLLSKIEKQLSSNSDPCYLVGNSITTADCALGAWLLKFYLGESFHHKAFY